MSKQKMKEFRDKVKSKYKIEDFIGAISPLNSNNKCNCPFHDENSASFTVYPKTQTFKCYGCGEYGDIFGFYIKYKGVDFKTALNELAEQANVKRPKRAKSKLGKIVETYDYNDSNGVLQYQVCRYEPKDFRQRQPDKKNPGKWTWKVKDLHPLPYHREKWHDLKHKSIFIVGGEKDVHTIESLGLHATCNHGGEGKFYPSLSVYFKDFNVFIIPDNDQAGIDHAQLVASVLQKQAKSIRIIDLELKVAKEDVTDWVEKYDGTKAELQSICKSTQEMTSFQPMPQKKSTQYTDTKEKSTDNKRLPLYMAIDPMQFPQRGFNEKPLGTDVNFSHMLNTYGIKVQYNVISKEPEIQIPGLKFSDTNDSNCTLTKIQSLCQLNKLPKDMADSYMNLIADQNSYNPIMDWIQSKDWDGRSRIGEFADTIKTKSGYPKTMRHLLIRKWLISCIASCSMDKGYIGKGVLTFQGVQDLGKTSWFRRLVSDDLQKYIKDDVILNPSDKDSIMKCIQHWIVELGELDGTFKNSDPAKLKGFISSNCDVLRRPYSRKESRFHRKTTFFASVNESSFLVDKTGNVRFWVIPVIGLDHEHKIDIQQLWAEIWLLKQANENWWLQPDDQKILEELNRNHEEVSSIEELIMRNFDPNHSRVLWKTATDVLNDIGFPITGRTQDTKEAGAVLKRTFGDQHHKANGRCYHMPHRIGKTIQEHKETDMHPDNMTDDLPVDDSFC